MLRKIKFWLESATAHDKRTKGLFLFLLWTGAELFAYLRFGVTSPVDTVTYVSLAEGIMAGHWPSGSDFFYSGYALLLALIYWAGMKYQAIVFVQIACSGCACYCIYTLTQRLSENNLSAFIAAFLYICWMENHQWNMIIYTDSLFTSLLIISITMVCFSLKPVHYLITGAVLLFTFLVRPTGILLAGSLLSYFTYGFVKEKSISGSVKIGALLILLIGYLVLLNLALSYSIDSFFRSYSNAEIIYPNISLGIEKPDHLLVPSENYPALLRFFLFITSNVVFFMKITSVKALLFLSHVKPYYSIIHNLLIALILWPVYGFALLGLKSDFNGLLKILMTSFVLLQLLLVSATSENWDGRFLLPILPFIFILSSLGVTLVVNRALKI